MKKVLFCLVLAFGLNSVFSQGGKLILLLVPIQGSDDYYGQLADSSGLYIGPVIQIAHQVGQAFLRSPASTTITAEIGAATATFSMYVEEASEAISSIILRAAENEATENDEVSATEETEKDSPEEVESKVSDLEPDSELADSTVKKIEDFVSSLLQEDSTEVKPLGYDEMIALFKEEASKDKDLKETGYKEEEIVAAYYLALDLYLKESGKSIHSIKNVDDLRNILFTDRRWSMAYIIEGAKKGDPNTKLALKVGRWAKSDPLNGVQGITEEDIANAYHAVISHFNRSKFGGFWSTENELQLKMLLIEKRSAVVERLNYIIKENQHRESIRKRNWF